jgi:hypothetical protein
VFDRGGKEVVKGQLRSPSKGQKSLRQGVKTSLERGKPRPRDLDKFSQYYISTSIVHSTWGHGESGYYVTFFETHDEAEAKKAQEFLDNMIYFYENHRCE